MIKNFINSHMYLFKNCISYYGYLSKIKKEKTISLFLSVIIFISPLGVVFSDWNNKLNNLSQNGSLVILVDLMFSAIAFIFGVVNIIKEIGDYQGLIYGKIVDKEEDGKERLKQIKISEIEKELGYEIIECKINKNKNDYVLNSPKIDRYITDNLMVIREDKKMEKLVYRFIQDKKDNLMPFLKSQYRDARCHGKGFFNERKLCLSKDIQPNDNKYIYCHKGTYYDTFLTNIISGKQLKSNQDNSIIESEEKCFLATKGRELKSITSSLMNNEMGISTLGITLDNYLVVWTQNRFAQSSDGLLVPTGSGSCDWSDKVKDNFNETIINAMKRELWEESGKRNLSSTYKDIGETKIIGFFRWIVKGGKPEFVGITKMNNYVTSFFADKREVYEGDTYKITKIEDVERIITEILDIENISVPLYMNLLCLKRYYNNNKKELEEFIFGKNDNNIGT